MEQETSLQALVAKYRDYPNFAELDSTGGHADAAKLLRHNKYRNMKRHK